MVVYSLVATCICDTSSNPAMLLQPFQSEQVQADGMRKAKGDEEDLDISDISADNKTDSTQWA